MIVVKLRRFLRACTFERACSFLSIAVGFFFVLITILLVPSCAERYGVVSSSYPSSSMKGR